MSTVQCWESVRIPRRGFHGGGFIHGVRRHDVEISVCSICSISSTISGMEPAKPTPEQAPVPGNHVEQLPVAAEQGSAATATSAPATPPASLPVVVATTAATAAASPDQAPVTTATPPTANDVDVLEKEWVDHAEAAIKKTEGDPRAEETAVEDLQVDYMKKRYGKDIKKAQE